MFTGSQWNVIVGAGGVVASSGSLVESGTAVVVPPALTGEGYALGVRGVSNLTGDDFTAMSCFAVEASDAARHVFSRTNGGTGIQIAVLADGTVQGRVSSTRGSWGVNLRSVLRVDDSQWHSVAVTGDKNWLGAYTLTLWIDGVRQAVRSFDPGLFGVRPDFSMSTDFYAVGSEQWRFTGAWAGSALWSSALSESQLRAEFAALPDSPASFKRLRYGWGVIL